MKINSKFFIIVLFLSLACVRKNKDSTTYKSYTISSEYLNLKSSLARGWNTWDTRSVLSHVLLPEGFAIQLEVKEGISGETLKEALIGRLENNVEQVIPGMHAYDGSYTELNLIWKSINIEVKSATVDDEFYLLIDPIELSSNDTIIILPRILWNRKGDIGIDSEVITGQFPERTIEISVSGEKVISLPEKILVALDNPVAVSTKKNLSTTNITEVIFDAKKKFEEKRSKYNEIQDLYNSMQTVLAWNVIYEPTQDRVIAPVSRVWNCEWNGWVLFDWDTYFASYMLSLDNKELAYANVIAITKEITEKGFIPNFGSSQGKSNDRSQPPVGSFIVNEIYKIYGEKWFLNEVFEDLIKWNRWWEKNRDVKGFLCWGTDPYDTDSPEGFLYGSVGKKQGAMWESGLDNSPMYDDAIFDTITNILMLADVGLMSLYISDCKNLAEIARILGNDEIENELIERGQKYADNLEKLWDEKFGLYLNKDLISGELSYRLSPTHFYPLLAKVPNQLKAKRIIDEHFYNSEEFWGKYIIPSIARNDKAFVDNDYWRGRIWGPMNFLVYMGIRNYDLPDARDDLAIKSKNLLLKSWVEERFIYENYNSETGQGDDVYNSDKFYHWGALLSFIGIINEGYLDSSSDSLNTE